MLAEPPPREHRRRECHPQPGPDPKTGESPASNTPGPPPAITAKAA